MYFQAESVEDSAESGRVGDNARRRQRRRPSPAKRIVPADGRRLVLRNFFARWQFAAARRCGINRASIAKRTNENPRNPSPDDDSAADGSRAVRHARTSLPPVIKAMSRASSCNVASPIAGRLDQLSVKRGDQVAVNARLYALEAVSEAAAQRQAQEQVKAAEAQLADLRSGPPAAGAGRDARAARASRDRSRAQLRPISRATKRSSRSAALPARSSTMRVRRTPRRRRA